MRTLLIVSALVLMVVSMAPAAPRTGVAVPLAQALPPGTLDVQIDTRGSQMLQGMEAQQVFGAQLGLPYGYEVGIDVRLGDPQNAWHLTGARNHELDYNPDIEGWDTVWFNVKKQLVAEKVLCPAVSIGLITIGSEAGPHFWITASKQFASVNVSLGASDVSDDTIWYEAVSYQPTPAWKFIAEHTGGATMSTNFAVEHRLSDDWTGTIAWMKANDNYHDDALFLRANYSHNFLWW